jgi:diguanylate cyclase (GGDEF)-like protein/PAS domain S-box-containing protein
VTAVVLVAALVGVTVAAVAEVGAVVTGHQRVEEVEDRLDRADQELARVLAAEVDGTGSPGELAAAASELAEHRDVVGDEVLAALEEVVGIVAAEADADAGGSGPDRRLVDAVATAAVATTGAEREVSRELGAEQLRTRWRANVLVSLALVGWAIVGVATGVTLWRRRRQRLEAFYGRILDALPDRVHVYRAEDQRLVFCNRAWAEPHGRSSDALAGEPLQGLLSPDELAGLRDQLPRLLAGEVVRDSTSRRPGPDGSTVVESWDDRLLDGDDLIVSVGRDLTERHRLTEELARGRSTLAAIVDAVPSGVMAVDGSARVIAFNRAAADLYRMCLLPGAPLSAVYAAGIEYLDADGRPLDPDRLPLVRALGGEDRVTVEFVLRRSDTGEEVPLRATGQRWCDDRGELQGAVAVIHDMSQLQAAERQLRVILDAIRHGVLLHDAAGRVVAANAAAAELLDEDGPETLVGLPTDAVLSDAVDGSGRRLGRAFTPVSDVVTGSEAVGPVEVGVGAGGDRRWLRVAAEPVTTDDGPGAVVSLTDVTAEHDGRRALAESEERFRSLADGAPVPVFTMGPDTGIDYANAALCELVRAPLERFAGLRWLEFLADEERDGLVAAAVQAATEVVEVRREHHVVPVDDPPRYVETTLRPIEGGRRLIGTIVDLTERREVEQRLAHDATHDALTGLANRALLVDRLTHSLGRARRSGAAPTLLFLDLDRFKPVNDRHGHAAGDHVLAVVADRIAGQVRAGDTVARLGGDEFVVLAEPPISRHEADALALRLLDRIMVPVTLPDGAVVAVGASIGVASGAIDDDPAALLARADAAVYSAKVDGRGRIHRQPS